jgi:hypothetical protein
MVVFVFLSYAEEDREIAAEISAWLGERGVEVFNWLERGSGRFTTAIEDAIREADAFLALLSPSFQRSDWCLRERDMAQTREQSLQRRDPRFEFIHVLLVAEISPADAGLLGSYNWLGFSRPEGRAVSFAGLARRLGLNQQTSPAAARLGRTRAGAAGGLGSGSPPPPSGPRPASGAGPDPVPATPRFRNREDELELALRRITMSGGDIFWLVTAPPKLGKTWFLNQLSRKLLEAEPEGWIVRIADIRADWALHDDAGAVLAQMFGRSSPVATDSNTLLDLAQGILGSEKAWLCLVDHAELLTKTAASTLRSCLSQIHGEVERAGITGVRLGLVVATRRDTEWLGIAPSPRLSKLPLTEFKIGTVQEALQELAIDMRKKDYSHEKSLADANVVYSFTQGLPAMLVSCLDWIRGQRWTRFERLTGEELFETLAGPFIRDELMNWESLTPGAAEPDDSALALIEQAYRLLVPYRLFTRSHLQNLLQDDFRTAVQEKGWSTEDMWVAVSGTALLARLAELWKVIQPAVRRLLYRHYYPSAEACVSVHSEARKFVEVWATRREPPDSLSQRLLRSAGTLSAHLQISSTYTIDDLRSFAADELADDTELQQVLSEVPALFAQLIDVVRNPPPAPRTKPEEMA